MRTKDAEKFNALMRKAAFADKVIALVRKHDLMEEPLRRRRRIDPSVPQGPHSNLPDRSFGASAQEPEAALHEPPTPEPAPASPNREPSNGNDLVTCESCRGVMPRDAYEIHVTNCTFARGRAQQE